MSIGINGKTLSTITRDLSLQWQHTKDYWKDSRSQDFERLYIMELLSNVENAVTVIEQLDKLIAKVRRDCE